MPAQSKFKRANQKKFVQMRRLPNGLFMGELEHIYELTSEMEDEDVEIEINDVEIDMTTIIEPLLLPNEREIVLITHDESTFYANDGKRVVWMENGKKKIRPKTVGTSIMISGFTCECHGFMHDDVLGLKSYLTFKAGKNREGWFTNDDLVKKNRYLMASHYLRNYTPGKTCCFLLIIL